MTDETSSRDPAAYQAPPLIPRDKAPYGTACNNCGQCCMDQLCILAQHVFSAAPDDGPCPALTWGPDKASGCGLVQRPADHAPIRVAIVGHDAASRAAALIIGAGVGCDGRLECEPGNPEFSARLRRYRQDWAHELHAALKVWGLDRARTAFGRETA